MTHSHYLVVEKGVHRQRILGLYKDLPAAEDRARAVAEQEGDVYHDYQVIPLHEGLPTENTHVGHVLGDSRLTPLCYYRREPQDLRLAPKTPVTRRI